MLRSEYQRLVEKGKINVTDRSRGYFRYDARGQGHTVVIGQRTWADRCTIRLRGRNNTLIIGDDVKIGPECSIWMEGEGLKVVIGSRTTFTMRCHLNVQERDNEIVVGEDCMFSNNIIVRTSDSHPICDVATGKRLNPPRSVRIGNHVWIAPKSTVMKGSEIGDGSIVGSDTMTSRSYPANTLIVGHPAKVVKEGVTWTRDTLW